MFLLFLFGEGRHTNADYAGYLVVLLRLAACAGLLLAWRRELLGGAIALGGILLATLVRPWVLGATLALTIPGILFLAAWALSRPNARRASAEPVPR